MSDWQAEMIELLAYGKRLGYPFARAWREALECVRVPMLDRGPQRPQLTDEEPVLVFFERVCRAAWDGVGFAPPGFAEVEMDGGGVTGIGASRRVAA